MVSEEHQRLVNALAQAWERVGIRVTAIDMADYPLYFDQKYRNLSAPGDHGGIPDLEGMDANGTLHLGEAETDMRAENMDSQLKNFSSRVMRKTRVRVPLHVVVPTRLVSQMESKINQLGLGSDMASGRIKIWS